MDLFKRHAILSAAALISGILLLAWLQPATSGGAVVVVVFVFLVFNAAGALFRRKGEPAKPREKEKG
jgi:hypothetical protein